MTTSTLTSVVRQPTASLRPVVAPALRRTASAVAYPTLLLGLVLVLLGYGAAALALVLAVQDLLG